MCWIQFEELIVRPAFRAQFGQPEGGAPPGAENNGELRARIQFRPELFVAQERVAPSTAPAWDGTGSDAPAGFHPGLPGQDR